MNYLYSCEKKLYKLEKDLCENNSLNSLNKKESLASKKIGGNFVPPELIENYSQITMQSNIGEEKLKEKKRGSKLISDDGISRVPSKIMETPIQTNIERKPSDDWLNINREKCSPFKLNSLKSNINDNNSTVN